MFEPDRGFVDLDTIDFAEFFGHTGRRERLDQRPAFAPYFEHVKGQQSVNFQLVKEAPVFVHDTNPVGVAVVRDAQVGMAVLHHLHQFGQVSGNRFGVMHAGENRVAFAVKLADRNFTAAQNAGIEALARAPHRVHHDIQVALLDAFHVYNPAQLLDIGSTGIEILDQTLAAGLLEGHPFNLAVQPALDFGHDFGRS